jgi:hypothetical protein
MLLDNGEHEKLAVEKLSLYYLLKMRWHKESRMIHGVQDRNGNIHKTTKGILRTFMLFMRSKYWAIAVDKENVNYMPEVGKKTIPTGLKEALDMPIAMEELSLTLGKGGGHKALGSDGICPDFFKATGKTTRNDMLAGHPRTPSHGIRRWDSDMGVDNATLNVDAAARPESNTHRKDHSPQLKLWPPQGPQLSGGP